MSWADEANAKAHTQWYNPDHGDGDCMKCQVNFQVREGFEMGAKWQRDQLRTDEATERVANCLHSLDHGETLDHHDAVCERDRGGCDRRELYSEDARAAITALIGED